MGALEFLKIFVISYFYRSDLTLRPAVIQLGNVNAIGVIESRLAGDKWQHSMCKRKGESDYRNAQQSQSNKQNSLTQAVVLAT